MSAPRPLPSSPAPSRLVALGLSLCVTAAIAGTAACRRGPDDHVLQASRSPAGGRLAHVKLARCDGGWCETLWTGGPGSGQLLATLAAGTERCTEIVWSRDAARVGFVINGYQLRLYNSATGAPAGLMDLVPRDADPTSRIARGLTFSENGAALTFDDCPRDRSGCRPGMVALR